MFSDIINDTNIASFEVLMVYDLSLLRESLLDDIVKARQESTMQDITYHQVMASSKYLLYFYVNLLFYWLREDPSIKLKRCKFVEEKCCTFSPLPTLLQKMYSQFTRKSFLQILQSFFIVIKNFFYLKASKYDQNLTDDFYSKS